MILLNKNKDQSSKIEEIVDNKEVENIEDAQNPEYIPPPEYLTRRMKDEYGCSAYGIREGNHNTWLFLLIVIPIFAFLSYMLFSEDMTFLELINSFSKPT